MKDQSKRTLRKSKGRISCRVLSIEGQKIKEISPFVAEWNFDDAYASLLQKYEKTKKPVEVNFRELVPVRSGSDRITHLIHTYPAKLLPNIPIFFCNCSQLSKRGDLILDPFCGTGTVLLEALVARRDAAGADANPLARLVSRVKVTPISQRQANSAIARVLASARSAKSVRFRPVVDVNKWFAGPVAVALGKLLAAIREIGDSPTRDFLEVCFSNCVKKLSTADPRLSVPVQLKESSESQPFTAAQVRKTFLKVATANAKRLAALEEAIGTNIPSVTIYDDARNIRGRKGSKRLPVGLIITSPPYVSAQKYIRASTLSIGWLGLAPQDRLRNLEVQNIGREHFGKEEYAIEPTPIVETARASLRRIWKLNPLRAHIAATYLREMKVALEVAINHLKRGGYFVLVIGDNTICGETFSTGEFLSNIVEGLGLEKRLELVDDIRSRGLMTKRNKTAGLITREHIHVYQKA